MMLVNGTKREIKPPTQENLERLWRIMVCATESQCNLILEQEYVAEAKRLIEYR